MQEKRIMDFNPLDLLATAAALQREEPKSVDQTDQSERGLNSEESSTDESPEEEKCNKGQNSVKMGSVKKVQNGLKRQKSCTLSGGLKMLSEHSYGNQNSKQVGASGGKKRRRHSWSAETEVLNSAVKIVKSSVGIEESSQDMRNLQNDNICVNSSQSKKDIILEPVVHGVGLSVVDDRSSGSILENRVTGEKENETSCDNTSKTEHVENTQVRVVPSTLPVETGGDMPNSQTLVINISKVEGGSVTSCLKSTETDCNNTFSSSVSDQSCNVIRDLLTDKSQKITDVSGVLECPKSSVSIEDSGESVETPEEMGQTVENLPQKCTDNCEDGKSFEFADSLECGIADSFVSEEKPAFRNKICDMDLNKSENDTEFELVNDRILEDSERHEFKGSSEVLSQDDSSHLEGLECPETNNKWVDVSKIHCAGSDGIKTDDEFSENGDIRSAKLPCSDDSIPVYSVESDHCYASLPGKKLMHSGDYTEDSIDCTDSDSIEDENSYVEEAEERVRSLSVDSSCLHCGFAENSVRLSTQGSTDYDETSSVDERTNQSDTSLMSPTSSSVDSLSRDSLASELNHLPFKVQPLMIPNPNLAGGTPHDNSPAFVCSDDSKSSMDSSCGKNRSEGNVPLKVGKFRIGTFASFSPSGFSLGKDMSGGRKHDATVSGDSSTYSPCLDKGIIGSPIAMVPASPGIPAFLQSPCGDWDRSDAGSEVQDDHEPTFSDGLAQYMESPVTEQFHSVGEMDMLQHSVHHDHDYCFKGGNLITGSLAVESRFTKAERKKCSTWAKPKIGLSLNLKEPKLKVKGKSKVKKLKMELLDKPTLSPPVMSFEDEFKKPDEFDLSFEKPNPVGRPKRRLEKLQEQLELDAGSKLKITGKFKDQYVYYLNKSSRSRRRASHDVPPPPPSDRIILPAPKPGDIIVPHLTDADIEAIKLRGKSGLSIGEKYYGAASSLPSSLQSSTQPTECMVDVDSKIINTILSMENDNLGSPASVEESVLTESIELYGPTGDSMGISFMGENMTLTPDQVDMLLDAMKDVETTPEGLLDGGSKFNLDNNQNYNPVTGHHGSNQQHHPSDAVCSSEGDHKTDSMSNAVNKGPIDENSLQSDDSSLDCAQTKSKDVEVGDPPIPSAQLLDSSLSSSAPVPVSASSNESPVKALLDADLNNMSAPSFGAVLTDISLPTLGKPFDLLGSDFRLDKSDLFPDATVVESAPCPASSAVSDYNTPWIVTVTMFWNDLPAIMIENQPYVRLVDIHKQILPAKDTGILKKRCQLLGIEVLNCSEMQRYFLVQYGRAYNSKSTLIVSKDDAKVLIGYYVNPQPRSAKLEDATLRKDEMEIVGMESEMGAPAENQSQETFIKEEVSPPTVPSKRRFRSKLSSRLSLSESSEDTPPALCLSGSNLFVPANRALPQVSKRLRHKKINFLELLRGEAAEAPSIPEVGGDQSNAKEKHSPESGKKHANQLSETFSSQRRTLKMTNAEKLKLAKEELKKRRIKVLGGILKEKKPRKIVSIHAEDDSRSSEAENEKSPKRKRIRSVKTQGESYVNGRGRSRLNKFGPLKVKVKGLIHFKKGRKSLFGKDVDPEERILGLRHKDTNLSSCHPSVSQDGDVHLDLYRKKSSLCIKCCSCKKFLSLRNFMSHQHYPDDTETLTTVAQQQILEPRGNKLSDVKRRLWEEFNQKKEELDGRNVAPPSRPYLFKAPIGVRLPSFHQEHLSAGHTDEVSNVGEKLKDCVQIGSASSVPLTVENAPVKPLVENVQVQSVVECSPVSLKVDTGPQSFVDKNSLNPSNENVSHGLAVETVLKTEKDDVSDQSVVKHTTDHTLGLKTSVQSGLKKTNGRVKVARIAPRRAPSTAGVRVSSRKRKERQLFPIENYTFSKKAPRLDVPLSNGEEDLIASALHKTDTNGMIGNKSVNVCAAMPTSCENVLTLCNGPELTSYTALQEGPEI